MQLQQRILSLSKYLMPLSILMMLLGTYIGYIDHEHWSMPVQISAHIAILIGATLLKISYVMYLSASMQLGINEFSGRKKPRKTEDFSRNALLPACCIGNKPCI